MSKLLNRIIQYNSSEKASNWLQQRRDVQQTTNAISQFNQTFTAIPRFVGKETINVQPEDLDQLSILVPEFFVQGWTLDRLVRVWWLLQLPASNKNDYVAAIENLFNAAEMNELAALYSALPLLAWPEEWIARTSEGIRSNIGIVQEAIMLNNPFPANYLSEPAWNQLVMKAIFTDKPLHRIVGLDRRANAALANILTDFAHERWAAGRTLDPMQWRVLINFITEDNLADIARIASSVVPAEREAAAIVCTQTKFEPAKKLIPADLADAVRNGEINWNSIAEKTIK
ncbi:hypothetical protein DVR12_13190 [Chitinophaga silvatica]|uniref:EboA domain-containing protein n=1 Tax=Chitinophaga silvatica TaxID=2282649 RepID=A0A3E1YB23_9BACT|nr:hypothetical protein DVR12_13190 [Chitinophaga silvatica]